MPLLNKKVIIIKHEKLFRFKSSQMKTDVLEYDGYYGSVHFSAEDLVFYGKIEGIDDLITFEGESVTELTDAFHAAVDDYLKLCAKNGRLPAKTCRGSLNVRLKPETHRKAYEKALLLGISLNQLIQRALDHELQS